jgi:hypothetical protein
MKDILNAVFATLIAPLIEAIDRNTSAVSGFCQPATLPCPQTSEQMPDTGTPEVNPEAGKKEKGKKAKATPAVAPVAAHEPAPAPEPVAVAPTSAPETEDEGEGEGEYVPTGEELVEIMEPLRPSKDLIAELIAFKKDVLGYQAPARTMVDASMRAKFHEKILELLERQQEA